MADNFQALLNQIEVLKFEKNELLNSSITGVIAAQYGLTAQQAKLVAFFLDGRMKTFDALGLAMEPAEPATVNHLNVQLHRIRKAQPWMKIKSIRAFGYQMALDTISRIKSDITDK